MKTVRSPSSQTASGVKTIKNIFVRLCPKNPANIGLFSGATTKLSVASNDLRFELLYFGSQSLYCVNIVRDFRVPILD